MATYDSLFKHNIVELSNLNGLRVINTVPHSVNIGSIIVPAGHPTIIQLFLAEKEFVETGEINGIPVGFYRYIVDSKLRNELLKSLNSLDIYALGSVISVLAFNHPRVIKIERNSCLKIILSEQAATDKLLIS